MEKDQAELMILVSELLVRHDIPHMITGAWSVIYYGRPRASHDIDFVVDIPEKEQHLVIKAIKTLGTDFLFQKESIKEAVKEKRMFNILYLPTMLKLDFWMLKDEPFDQSRFSRKKQVKILNHLLWLASAEDTILQKLKWYQKAKIEKHLIDAAFVYQIQKKNLDGEYLKKWAKILGVSKNLGGLEKINLENYM